MKKLPNQVEIRVESNTEKVFVYHDITNIDAGYRELHQKKQDVVILHNRFGKTFNIGYFRSNLARDIAYNFIYGMSYTQDTILLPHIEYFRGFKMGDGVSKHIRSYNVMDIVLKNLENYLSLNVPYSDLINSSPYARELNLKFTTGDINELITCSSISNVDNRKLVILFSNIFRLPTSLRIYPKEVVWSELLSGY